MSYVGDDSSEDLTPPRAGGILICVRHIGKPDGS